MRKRWSPAAAQERAAHRWTPWRLLALPLAGLCFVGLSLALGLASLEVAPLFPPEDAFFCTTTRYSPHILVVVTLFLAMAPGFIIANSLVWLIPPARRALDRAEARVGNSLSKANASLVKFFLVTAAILVPIHLLAAGSAVCLSREGIHYRALSLAPLTVYPFSHIEAVRPLCSKGGRGTWNVGLLLAMREGGSFDLVADSRRRFAASSAQIIDVLRGRRWDFSGMQGGCPHHLRKLIATRG